MDLLEQLHGCRMARESTRVNMQCHRTYEEEDGGVCWSRLGFVAGLYTTNCFEVSGEGNIDG